MYIHTSFVCSTLRVILQGFVTQNATWCQNRGCICISSTRRTYGRIHSSFLHPAYIQTSTINSVDRIISKEEERERRYPRRDSSIYLRVVFPHSYKNYSVSTRNPATPSNSTYRINSSPRTTRLIPCRLLPATVPLVSKHSTRQNKAPGPPYSIPRPYRTSRLPVILPGRNSILGSRQHPHSPYSSSQAKFYITEFYQEK